MTWSQRAYARYAQGRGWTERWLSLHAALPWNRAQQVWRLYREAHHRWWTGQEGATGPAISLPVPGYPQFAVYLRPGTSDIMVYCDVLVNRLYGRYLPDPPITRVLDVGANIGMTSVFFLTRLPGCRVVAVEPDPVNAGLCRQNLAPFGPRAMVVEAAVWPEEARLALSAGHGGTWASSVVADGRGSIEGHTMQSLLDLLGGSADIVKVDVEGAELPIFEAADTSWIDHVRCISLEPEHAGSLAAFERAIRGRMRIVSRYRDVVTAARL